MHILVRRAARTALPLLLATLLTALLAACGAQRHSAAPPAPAPEAAAFKYFSLVSSLGEPLGLQSQPSIG
jgi:hypothetical protein